MHKPSGAASPRQLLLDCFHAALAAAAPGPAVLRHLLPKPARRCIVVGAGKATPAMAAALDAAWPDVDLTGVVATRYGHALPAGRVRVLEAGHPMPDENSIAAATEMLAAVRGLGPDDLVVALVSGGGSASLALPAPGIDLAAKQTITRALLKSGATILEMNTVRRHISAIKGGRLAAAAAPASVVTIVISDVPGDDPAIIASGPTLADGSHPHDALAILNKYAIAVPPPLRRYLEEGDDTPVPANNGEVKVAATPKQSLVAAKRVAEQVGIAVEIMGDAIEGESAEQGRAHGLLAMERARSANAPLLLLSGGETTVTIGPDGAGKGGRNTEFLLALALTLQGDPAIHALAADTDGIDGSEDAAGAIIAPGTLARAQSLGLDPQRMLIRHDSYSLFAKLGDLVVTGPTHTNVNDFRAILIDPAGQPAG